MSHSPTRTRRFRALGVALVALTITGGALSACSDDPDTSAGSSSNTGSSDMTDDATMTALDPSGPACSSVPVDGAGSFSGMAQDPAATAASNNPALSTLVTAVQAAGLVDTLNGEGPFTIFAPASSAFEKIPADTLQSVLVDTAALTDILTYHVVAGEQLSSEQLVEQGSATTVQGSDLTFTDANGTLTVNGSSSGVCVDVPTANATVHIIDTVLMPAA